MATKTKKVKLPSVKFDLRGVEEADDGNTSHYGGQYKVDGVAYPAYGNDRGDNYTDDAVDKIVEAAKILRPGLNVDEDSVLEAVLDARPKRVTTVRFTLDGGKLVAVVPE